MALIAVQQDVVAQTWLDLKRPIANHIRNLISADAGAIDDVSRTIGLGFNRHLPDEQSGMHNVRRP